MKKIHLAGNLLKVLLLGSMLAGCQPEDALSPIPSDETSLTDKNAKTALSIEAPKLIQDGAMELQYYTAGRDEGRLWKVSSKYNDPGLDYVDEYIYSNLAIVRTRYKKSNNLKIGEVHYYLNYDGLCTSSFQSGTVYEYEYNELKQLIKVYNKNNPNQHTDFEYHADIVGGFQSLFKAHLYDNSNVKYKEIGYGYVPTGQGLDAIKPDKYRLNLLVENNEIPGLVEMYLPIYGRFNTNLLRQVCVVPFPNNGQNNSALKYNFILDNNGYVKTRARISFPEGVTSQVSNVDYSYNLLYLKPLNR